MKSNRFVTIMFVLIVFLVTVISGCSNSDAKNSTSTNSYNSSNLISSKLQTSSFSSIISSENSQQSITSALKSNTVQSNSSINTSTSQSNSTSQQQESDAYETSGQISKTNDKFRINQNFIVTFNFSNKNFNKISFNYTSTKPLKCVAVYEGNTTVSDTFYLYQDSTTFNLLTKNYLNNVSYTKIKTITFNSMSSEAEVSISNFKFEKVTVYSENVTYLENTRYKVGIKLLWGGGISYIKDKTSNIEGVDNLVNQADTGRLIQQSYYGTLSDSKYQTGTYNSATWSYNPVQGGDVNNNHSRLIDVKVESNKIYVKSQPQDWAKNNQLTPSYMENTYFIDNEKITVTNNFIDFSQYTHRFAHQELPAFYTISYLDSFSYYNGTNPWTNAACITENSLPFWGDSSVNAECYHNFKNANTETWCAWTNTASNFGIGLYTANVDCLLAGRHNYNQSKDSTNSACSYVAPLKTIMMQSFEPISYSYIITTGTLQNIRNTFLASKDYDSNQSLSLNSQSMRTNDTFSSNLDFSTSSNISLLQPTNATAIYDSTEKAAKLTVTAVDPQIFIPFSSLGTSYYGEACPTVTIRYKIPQVSLTTLSADLFYCSGSVQNPSASYVERKTLIADNQYHDLVINLNWTGKINCLRFDFFDSAPINHVMYLKSINF